MTTPGIADDEGTFTCTTCGRTGWWAVESTSGGPEADQPEHEFSISHNGEDLAVQVDQRDLEEGDADEVWRRLFAQLQDLTGCRGGEIPSP